MLATQTTWDVFADVRDAVANGRPWSYWSAPGEAGRLVEGLTAIEFPQTSAQAAAPASYPERVALALGAIREGRVAKVVVAREEVLPPADPVATLAELQRRFPNCWVFAISDGRETFLGATPELLARVTGTTLETCALAGTAEPGADALLQSAKDLHEHELVVDAIRQSLDELCDDVVVDAPALMVLPNVQHLRSAITATMRRGVSAADIVTALHPTPAVCGTPRDAARRLIGELEPFERGLYAGVIGFVDDDAAEFVVAIRSARLTPEATYVYAGAGIVAGSDPDAEDRETRAKLRAVTEALRFR